MFFSAMNKTLSLLSKASFLNFGSENINDWLYIMFFCSMEKHQPIANIEHLRINSASSV
ncbi:MAG: hypothetical protein OFPI_38010 [Osedax symbiont Rs2]|nr:MAG: hypothetical protein OFPI_38010 [Osedax symbiont Rs2]